jgi:hypothetical protein
MEDVAAGRLRSFESAAALERHLTQLSEEAIAGELSAARRK